MYQIGEALTAAQATGYGRTSGQKVHRHTKHQPGQEGRFWQPFSRRNSARFLRAAERYDRLQRLRHRADRNGLKNGTLGHIGLEVLRELLRLIDYRTGRLDPAIATIAERVGRSIAAVHAALNRLRAHGFLSWLRRYVPTGRDGLRGPQVRQTSNAYALTIPAAARLDDEPPAPEDDQHRRQTAADEAARMIAELPLFERNRELFDGDGLADAVSRLEAAIMAREALA